MEQTAGDWSGPVASRFGYHLIFVHERQPAYVPALDVIGDLVRKEALQKLADEYLAVRIQELRAAYDVVLPKGAPS